VNRSRKQQALYASPINEPVTIENSHLLMGGIVPNLLCTGGEGVYLAGNGRRPCSIDIL